jgi:hypothetical protein
MLVAATAAKATGSVLGGKAQKRAAYDEAAGLQDEARAQAKVIRRQAAESRSTAAANYAASGVSVAEGTPLIIDRVITQRSEEDVGNTLLTADRRAAALRKSGKAAQTAGYLNAAGSVLQTGASISAGGWK